MYYEDAAVGSRIPPLTRGPISPMHIVRWSAAMENWHRIHYDWKFATEHDGLPDIPISGSWKQHILVQLVSQWIGDAGWLLTIGYRFERPDIVWDTITGEGIITRTEMLGEQGVVECELTLTNQRGEVSTRANCTVLLPVRGAGAIPYPVPPELAARVASSEPQPHR